jgi:hypothetical protein
MATNDSTQSESVRLHAETIREIAAEYPDADKAERRLRVAIREAICLTRHEEDQVYDVISVAVLCPAT